ncbi:helicase-associated domain-containing protein [Agromyces mediolanus]|uniref:helicase-associated domain-containing protein n=1 Tax=Agromyces mediolanus TaxID=41986 RepID=UPI00203E0519|nr:helicase-associated domain-containing protein [Agromyces mediolanus]MCM3655846.1 helicase-associated domain-containing protein [Agromyces mediolanus]
MLQLAAQLRGMGRDELRDALALREFSTDGISDLFDLAEALLHQDSLDHVVGRLDRPHLAVLAALATAEHQLDEVALAERVAALGAPAEFQRRLPGLLTGLRARLLVVDAEGGPPGALHVPAAIVARLAPRLGEDLPSVEALLSPAPPVLQAVDEVDRSLLARRASEQAYATVAATAELLAALGAQPARELAKGGLALPDARRLAEVAGVALDEVPRLFGRAVEAGLVVRDGAYWLESDAGANWSLSGPTRRWAALAECWRERVPPALRELVTRRSETLSAAAFREDVRWLYPVGGEWLDAGLARLAGEAEALGLAVSGEPVEPGRLVLGGRLDEAAALLGAHFPAQVDRVYVQHDLTIVSPGPLEPALDARLRGFADVEGRDLASSYRVTAASVNRGLAAGESADSIREFLGTLSLTGIPQPLEYLVAEAAARFGAVRVSVADDGDAPAKSSVRSDDEQLVGTLEVDQSLSAIGLRRVGPHRLLSRFAPDVVFWALSDARYPVAAEDAEGRILRLQRHRLAPTPTPAPAGDPVGKLLDVLLAAPTDGPATEQAWLARQLEAAARAKETLTVTVRMPGGQTADYLLAPASVANGRLRARDRKADIERTLPISAIASVAPAPEF